MKPDILIFRKVENIRLSSPLMNICVVCGSNRLVLLISPIDLSFAAIHSWQIFLAVCCSPSLLSGACVLFMPESPKFLMSKGRNEQAMAVFQKLYTLNTGRSREEYPVVVESFRNLSRVYNFVPSPSGRLKSWWMKHCPETGVVPETTCRLPPPPSARRRRAARSLRDYMMGCIRFCRCSVSRISRTLCWRTAYSLEFYSGELRIFHSGGSCRGKCEK